MYDPSAESTLLAALTWRIGMKIYPFMVTNIKPVETPEQLKEWKELMAGAIHLTDVESKTLSDRCTISECPHGGCDCDEGEDPL